METYTFMRELADSWVLIAMFAFFLGAAIWTFLPSHRSAREDASLIPFRNEANPSASSDTPVTKTNVSKRRELKGLDNV
ncbi:MAG TPA: CcoQ/FixQ family Cbb3-type cytochrome c oxidase assembly chaperone [Octadecabacter sp.]|nr:CcoQ/FixQ family Cbb3-type cytochrome c oxidase assembly chaperone [Octadecabacter sp.]